MADLVAGTAVPHAVKLKELTSEWRRMTVGGEAVLGMGGMMQMMQSVGSMFGGGGASDTFFTRGATITIGDQQFLIGYRLPVQGIDFGALMAMGAPEGARRGRRQSCRSDRPSLRKPSCRWCSSTCARSPRSATYGPSTWPK
jgi:hypothetical protein